MVADPGTLSGPDGRRPGSTGLRGVPVSRVQIETVLTRAVAIFGALLGAQTIPTVIAQLPVTQPVWNAIVIPLVYASLLLLAVATLVQRFARLAAIIVAVVYLIAVQTWPLVVVGTAPRSDSWLYFLMTVAVGAAAIGFHAVVATTYLVVVPVIYGLIRLIPAGGGVTWANAVLDVADVIIFGGIVVVIVTMLRYAAASVDAAQSTALDRYAVAVRQHATEVERVQVDSIVHDSVLTTFLSAARAYTPEAKELAASMAGAAIGHLREAAVLVPGDGLTVFHTELARRVTDAAETIGATFEIRSRALAARSLPVLAAEAIYSSVVQAMVNSLQHAGSGDVRRWLSVRPSDDGGFIVEIGDEGRGFDPSTVPTARLGLRVSILERMTGVGGRASIDSGVGRGTVITVEWPDQAGAMRS
jgi:signal transduction histidine kinase